VAVLLIAERQLRLRPGRLFVLSVGGYALGRLWVEAPRIDHANRFADRRVNEWVSIAVLGASVAFLFVDRRRRHQARDRAMAASGIGSHIAIW
jgi:prolipoprotein diacylglyceryltransferase